MRTSAVAFRGFAATPSGKSARHKHRGQQADSGEFRSIQHGSSFSFLALFDERRKNDAGVRWIWRRHQSREARSFERCHRGIDRGRRRRQHGAPEQESGDERGGRRSDARPEP
jgi:hypothetical protein